MRKLWNAGEIVYSTQNGLLTDIEEGNIPIGVNIRDNSLGEIISLCDLKHDGISSFCYGQIRKSKFEDFSLRDTLLIEEYNVSLHGPEKDTNYSYLKDIFMNADNCHNIQERQIKMILKNPHKCVYLSKETPFSYKSIYIENDFHMSKRKKYDNIVFNESNPAEFYTREFETLGTDKGDWRIPTIEDFSLIFNNIEKINKSLSYLKNRFNFDIKLLDYNNIDNSYMTSDTIYDEGTNKVFFVNLFNGIVLAEFPWFLFKIRPILKINRQIL